MPLLFLLLILAYPVAEIAAIFWLTDAMGGMLALLWLGSAFLIGSLMMRNHSLAVMATLVRDMRTGTIQKGSLFALARYYIAAVLFIIPGPISDVIALVLLLPWSVTSSPVKPVDDGVIEGDYRRVDPKPKDRLNS